MAAVLAAYGVAVLLLEPDYFTVLRELVLPFYPHFNPRPWWRGLTSVPALFTYTGLAAACLRLRSTGGLRGPGLAFVVYAFAWLAVAAFQQQAMSYHYLPALVHATLALGAAIALVPDSGDAGKGSEGRRPGAVSHLTRAAAPAVVAALALLFSYMYAGELRVLTDEEPTEYERLKATVLADGPAVPDGRLEMAALNVGFGMVFTLLNETDARWSLRYPGVWPILAARRKALSEGASPPGGTEEAGESPLRPLTAAERSFRQAIVHDLTTTDPDVFLVPAAISRAHGDGIDILRYLGRDSTFASWFRGYRYRVTVAGLEVYLRCGRATGSSSPASQGEEQGAKGRPQGG